MTIEAGDTAGSLYFQKLYPLGVDAIAEAVAAVADGSDRLQAQDEARASFQGLVGDAEARIDWSRPAEVLDRLARGCDPQPGAWAERGAERVRLFDVRLGPPAEGAAPGTLVGFSGTAARIAAQGGSLEVGRLRVGDGAKLAAAEAGLEAGARLT